MALMSPAGYAVPMKRLLFILMVLLVATPVMAADFTETVDDIPLMPGFAEDADNSFFWDKPEGRLATIIATGRAAPNDLRRFYADSLQALGWTGGFDADGAGSFRRDRELLLIRRESLPGGLTELIIDLTPLADAP